MDIKDKYPIVSIVLPTYNVERYLHQCLESINAQTYKNFECIIIIDGATDNSYEVAKQYCETHDKFFVYWQENAGSGPARNNGIIHSKGDFIMFIDPDDWIDENCLELLMKYQAEDDYDLTIARKRVCKFNQDGHFLGSINDQVYDLKITNKNDARKMFGWLLESSLISPPTWKIYRHQLIKDKCVEFPSYRRSQDVVFNYRYFSHVSKVRVIPYNLYNYRVELPERPGRVRKDYEKILAVMYNDIQKIYEDWNMPFETKRISHYLYVALYSYLGILARNNDDICFVKEYPFNQIVKDESSNILHFKIAKYLLRLNMLSLCKYFLRFKEFLRINIRK